MKNLRIFGIIAFLFGMHYSCEDFLKEELRSDLSADTYKTAEGYEAGVNAIYDRLRLFYGNEEGFSLTVFGTDTYTNGSDGDYKGLNVYDNRLNPSHGHFLYWWNFSYTAINQANAMIGRAAEVEGIDPDILEQRVAESRFIRALFYFNLVRQFGAVHLTLEETVGVELDANRTSPGEIYANAIVPDLEYAISVLPDAQDDQNYGRATKAAAEFLLSKVLLARGHSSFAESNDFSRAAQLAEGVINNYSFELLDNWADLWDINNDENAEVVWSVQYTNNPATNTNTSAVGAWGPEWAPGNEGHLYFLMEYDILPGMTRSVEHGRPWKRFRPTEFLLNSFNKDLDTRYKDGFVWTYLANDPEDVDKFGNPFNIGDTAVHLPSEEWPQSLIDSKPYMVITPDNYTEKLYPTLIKYLDPLRSGVQSIEGQRDFIVMRLAEAYLVAAEAHLMNGDPGAAADLINVIRRRAAVDGNEASMEITSADVDIDFILDERARELVGEQHRWYDLVRTGKLVERVKLHNADAAPHISDFHTLRPIPQEQIDRLQGNYAQNPDY